MAIVYLVTMFAALASVNSKVAIDPLSASRLSDEPPKNVKVQVGPLFSGTYGYVEQDEEEAKCVPTKEYEDTNVYAGMTGYDNYIGNPTDFVDPGVKSRIFLHDCAYGYYSFISDVGGDLNCESDFSMKRITSMDQFEQERTSSNKFKIKGSVAVSASYGGVKGEVSAAYARATNADEQAAVKVLKKYNGEIVQAKATCITMSVSIADNVRPLFTEDFINHLKDMHEALDLGDERMDITWKAFVNEFGTHFMRTTKLGSQITYERRLQSKATSNTEMKKRSECVKQEASASLKAKGYGASAAVAVEGEKKDCKGTTDGSDFAQGEGFEGVKVLSRGSRPADLNSWADNDNEFDPVPVERFLAPMTELFKDEWMTQSTFYGFKKSLNGAGIEEMFLTKMESYCSLMLDGILDSDCNYEVCTDEWTDKCKNGGQCKDEGGLPTCECTDGFFGDTCEETKDVDLPMFDGHCLDSSGDNIPTGVTGTDDKACEQSCQETEGCTAFSFTSTTSLCTLFENGPYTQGDGTENTKCYTMNEGFDQVSMMHCWEDKYEYHHTLADATTACVADSSCIGVYDHGCEKKGYYLCPVGALKQVWYSNPIKSCVHIKKEAKFCLKYQTATAESSGSANGNEVEVEVSFSDSTKTFVLDAPKVAGDSKEICYYATPHESLISVKIKQTKLVDGWLIRSLQLPERVGSPFYVAYAIKSNNEMFWVDGDQNCNNDDNDDLALECCENKDQCTLVPVTGVPCCSKLSVTATGPASSAMSTPFGVYNYFDRASNGQGIWRQEENENRYLYPKDVSDVGSGFMVGPNPEELAAWIQISSDDCDKTCPEDCPSKWKYTDGSNRSLIKDRAWVVDSTIEVACTN